MKTFIYGLSIIIILLINTAQAQKNNDIRLENLPYYNYGRGVGITSPDSIFQFNIRFRMQNRVSFVQNPNEAINIDGQIRRLRLRFDGYVGNPKFNYVVQLSFAPGDVGEIEEGENINIIRDAAVIYRPNKSWNIVFGQTKLPGNRQRINSSGALQLTDRSINNARFNIDRDFGLQAYYLKQRKEAFSYNIKTAISTGEGRNFTQNDDNNLAYTLKFEFMPIGSFTNDGVNFEGDLVREKKPKLFISPAYSFNRNAKKSGGQLGRDLFEPRDMATFFTDIMLKYRGLSLMYSFMTRQTVQNPVTQNPENPTETGFVWVGEGNDWQGSYLFKNNYELITRYSNQKPYAGIAQLAPRARQWSFGLTRYFWEHAFKLQSECTFDRQTFFNATQRTFTTLRFQVEMGI